MIGFDRADIEHIRCPSCFEGLEWKGAEHGDGLLHYGALICRHGHSYRVESGLPSLVDRQDLSQKDRAMDVLYNVLAPVHDMSVSYFLPLVQYPDNEPFRSNYIKSLRLDELDDEAETIRILEVGSGTGANFPLLKHGAPQSHTQATDNMAPAKQRTWRSGLLI